MDLGGGVKMKLCWVPPGEFMMGSNRGGEDMPLHKVTITNEEAVAMSGFRSLSFVRVDVVRRALHFAKREQGPLRGASTEQ
ncbi:MAG: hypothetical protein C0404_08150 [Verrucomicrobia bacterium]|nr:hypothetical protein [Verrucomicrobiota bacterium]